MGSLSDDLFQLVEETLGTGLLGMRLVSGGRIIAEVGSTGAAEESVEIPGKGFNASLFFSRKISPNLTELNHIRKILNIYTLVRSESANRLFSGAELLETITNRKTVDDVLKQLVNVLVERGGFCRAGIMFLNEALLELRGVIIKDSTGRLDTAEFKSTCIRFETKNQLSDVMFYDRTEVVSAQSAPGLEVLEHFFCADVMVTGLGVGDRPIGILLACKDSYTESDKEALLMYGNICSLSIEFSKTVKQLELTMTDLKNLRKSAVNSENLVKMGRLSATVAHELKNPLVAIGGFTKRMEQTAVNPQTKNYIKIVQSEVHRLEKIVGDILVYSRKVDLDIAEFRLSELIKDVLQIVESCLCLTMISVEVKIDNGLMVQADRDRMKQVVLNLISNSVQEMQEGGELLLEAAEGERHVTFSVTDTGGGIPEDKREKIFEPFYTVKKNGTGLGLPLCKKIMTAHGGDIVVGAAEKGAVFTLIIPKRGNRNEKNNTDNR
jgi:signal transduction histidine kinase